MADFFVLVREKLVAATAVTALVGAKIYPDVAPQGTLPPFVVLTVPSDVPVNSVDGTAESRLHTARVQIDAYAATRLQATEVADACAAVVGNLAAPELSATEDGRRNLYDDETQLRRVSMDFMVAA